MRLIRYKLEYQESMLALHRSAIEGFTLGMSQQEDEADLLAIEEVYLMYPAFLPLCFQMSELADALCPEIQRRKRGQQGMTVSRINRKSL